MNTSAWRIIFRTPVAILAAAVLSGCVVVVDGERGEDRDWDVRWGGDGTTVDRAATSDELAKDVASRIAGTPGLSGQDITASSRGNVVTLHGRVDSVGALEEAMAVAAATPGVDGVVSRLTVVQEGG